MNPRFTKRVNDISRAAVQREYRKQSRCSHWATRSVIEVAAITSIGWYLQMELFRTNQVPSSMTPALLRYCPKMLQIITKQAQFVYNKVYRDHDNSKFVLTDTGRNDLDGRRGEICFYDNVSRGYQALIYPKQPSTSRSPMQMLVKMENMEPVHKCKLASYNHQPKQDTLEVPIENHFPSTKPSEDSNSIMSVYFRHNVFLFIRKQFNDKPEFHSDEAFKAMTFQLDHVESKEQEEKERLKKEQIQHRQIMEAFLTTHKSGRERPRKRPRFHSAMPTPGRNIQINSVWAAKIEHIRSVINGRQDQAEEHLFTFPFQTIDNSLMECGNGSCNFDFNGDDCPRSDILFPSLKKDDPIVLTTAAVQSLSPGRETDDDAIDLCVQWCVFRKIFSFPKNFPLTPCFINTKGDIEIKTNHCLQV